MFLSLVSSSSCFSNGDWCMLQAFISYRLLNFFLVVPILLWVLMFSVDAVIMVKKNKNSTVLWRKKKKEFSLRYVYSITIIIFDPFSKYFGIAICHTYLYFKFLYSDKGGTKGRATRNWNENDLVEIGVVSGVGILLFHYHQKKKGHLHNGLKSTYKPTNKSFF